MNDQELIRRTLEITAGMRSLEKIGRFIEEDPWLKAPEVFRGKAKIRLIILGQDPTVQRLDDRFKVKKVLNLDRNEKKNNRYIDKLYNYIQRICQELGLDIEQDVYATNILKNFFTCPPDLIEKTMNGFIQKAFSSWRDLLIEELSEFEDIPVITLGEHVRRCVANKSRLIRYYWGYIRPRVEPSNEPSHILPNDNCLMMHVFPFPHIHGPRHALYRNNHDKYIAHVKKYIQ